MKALYWESLRQRWAEKQIPSGMEGYQRVPLLEGSWPQLWEGPKKSYVVTGSYFEPKAEKYAQYITAPFIILILYLVGSHLYGPKTGQAMGAGAAILLIAGLIATAFSRVICYHILAKKLWVEFRPGGEIRMKGATVPAGVPRSFLVMDHDEAKQEELDENFHMRNSQGKVKALPRYYRDACQIVLSYGSENTYQVAVASIGADAFHFLGTRMRGVLAEANKMATALPSEKLGVTLRPKSEFD